MGRLRFYENDNPSPMWDEGERKSIAEMGGRTTQEREPFGGWEGDGHITLGAITMRRRTRREG
jgi:hypothetical protein